MRKVLAIFAILALASCGNGKLNEVNSDSSAVAVDTVLVDSATVPVESLMPEVPVVEVK
jgi:hypothetical protein